MLLSNLGISNVQDVQDSGDPDNFMQSLRVTENYIKDMNIQMIDIQSQFMSLNQSWSETLARFMYELKM